MKVIGPYVVSVVAGAPDAPQPGTQPGNAPLHGRDRLTGVPVLLHPLREYVVPQAVPASAHLLPVNEVDVWDGQPYAVSELPPSASPASHPLTAAQGGLRALAALHAAGLVHGRVGTGQLWQVGREVLLAGAGLPGDEHAGPQGDVQALARALDALGPRPAALTDMEQLSAEQALARLETAQMQQERQTAAQRPAVQQRAEEQKATQSAPAAMTTAQTPAIQTPAIQAPEVQAPAVPPPAAPVRVPPPAPAPQASEIIVIAPVAEPPRPEPVHQRPPSEAPIDVAPPADDVELVVDGGGLEPVPTPAHTAAPEVIVIGEPDEELNGGAPPAVPQAPAARVAPVPTQMVPIQIGFDDVPELPMETRDPAPDTAPSPRPPLGRVAARAQPGPAPQPGPAVPTQAQPARAQPSRAQPLRIGWEEDHSWRVVKTGTASRTAGLPAAAQRVPRWALPALLLVLVAGVALWLSGRSTAPAAACCTRPFTVSGAALPVRVTLLRAPPDSPLSPGAVIGTAPGTLHFPGTPGRYILHFSAAGHATLSSAVTVPSTKPFNIALK